MYPIYNEVPSSSLIKLFLDPTDSDYVDSILYGQEVDAPPVPDCAFFQLTEEEKNAFGSLDLGKYDDYWNYDPFLKFLKLIDYDDSSNKLDYYLESHKHFYHLELELESTITYRVTAILGKKECVGFNSDEVCYGINGYRLPIELEYIWNQIEKVLEKYPQHINKFVALFRKQILYYYRISKRKNGDLFLLS